MTAAKAGIPARQMTNPLWRLVALGLVAIAAVAAYGAAVAQMVDLMPAGVIGVFLAAMVSSIAGFAFSALCGPVLVLLDMSPVRMVQTMALCSIAMQGWSVWALRRDIDLVALAPVLAGALCTLPLGVALLLHLPQGSHAAPIGGLILVYGLWALLRPPIRLTRPPGLLAAVLAGATGGITGGLAAFPSPVVVVWCGLRGWPKERQRGITAAYILVMQVGALGVIAVMSEGTGQPAIPDAATLAHVPAAVLGAVCGLRLFRGLTDAQFGRAVHALLVAAGAAMLF